MHESAGVGERDHAEIDEEKSRVAVDLGEQQVADSHEQDRREHDRLRPVAVEQMADDRSFDGAFGARQGKSQRRGCSVEI